MNDPIRDYHDRERKEMLDWMQGRESLWDQIAFYVAVGCIMALVGLIIYHF